MTKSQGKVYLVGAGPGDKGLITVKGARLISEADCIIYDALANPELLLYAREDAEVIFGGKKPNSHTMSQEILNELLITKAREGKTVVRLKGGDPYVFGRGGEEGLALREGDIHFEMVPGISSVSAVPAYAGIPLTHRKLSSSFSVFTGRSNPDQKMPDYPWETIARTPGTKVLLMCVERFQEIAQALMDHGLKKDTPAAMISWGTYGRQKSVVGDLESLGELAMTSGIVSPSIAIIGEVVRLSEQLNWFERKPLFGRRIVVTRPVSSSDALHNRLSELGAEIMSVPTIRSDTPTRSRELVECILGIGEYDWIVFTSTRGVEAFFDAFFKAFNDIRSLGNLRIAAVGPATAKKLQDFHLVVDAVPASFKADQITNAIQEHESIENIRILLARAEVANMELPKDLESKGAIVDDVACYRTIAETEDPFGMGEKLQNDGADWLTFASGSAVESFHDRFDLPDLLETYPEMKVASIGPETSKVLNDLGVTPTLEAKQHTGVGLAHTIAEYELRSISTDY